jgi:hypothetical protein
MTSVKVLDAEYFGGLQILLKNHIKTTFWTSVFDFSGIIVMLFSFMWFVTSVFPSVLLPYVTTLKWILD